ncbi:hypothetical protein NL108_017589, partial [Boleophthalmus pectinirostris]
DAVVSCVLLGSCVLPCSFESGPDPVIQWTKPHEETQVHIYYYGHNQPERQHQNFTKRTSLFEEEVSTGNASLRLSGVRVQDEGKYKCHTSPLNSLNITESSVDVLVSAPVSLQQRGQMLLCRSEGVYPKPSVSWSPSSHEDNKFTLSEDGLWSVESFMSLHHSSSDEYRCRVSNNRGSWRSATYRTNSVIHYYTGLLVVSCTETSAPVKSLIWKFGQTQIILNWTGPVRDYTQSWKQFMDGVTFSNGLVLKDLTEERLGLFSCELYTEQE